MGDAGIVGYAVTIEISGTQGGILLPAAAVDGIYIVIGVGVAGGKLYFFA